MIDEQNTPEQEENKSIQEIDNASNNSPQDKPLTEVKFQDDDAIDTLGRVDIKRDEPMDNITRFLSVPRNVVLFEDDPDEMPLMPNSQPIMIFNELNGNYGKESVSRIQSRTRLPINYSQQSEREIRTDNEDVSHRENTNKMGGDVDEAEQPPIVESPPTPVEEPEASASDNANREPEAISPDLPMESGAKKQDEESSAMPKGPIIKEEQPVNTQVVPSKLMRANSNSFSSLDGLKILGKPLSVPSNLLKRQLSASPLSLVDYDSIQRDKPDISEVAVPKVESKIEDIPPSMPQEVEPIKGDKSNINSIQSDKNCGQQLNKFKVISTENKQLPNHTKDSAFNASIYVNFESMLNSQLNDSHVKIAKKRISESSLQAKLSTLKITGKGDPMPNLIKNNMTITEIPFFNSDNLSRLNCMSKDQKVPTDTLKHHNNLLLGMSQVASNTEFGNFKGLQTEAFLTAELDILGKTLDTTNKPSLIRDKSIIKDITLHFESTAFYRKIKASLERAKSSISKRTLPEFESKIMDDLKSLIPEYRSCVFSQISADVSIKRIRNFLKHVNQLLFNITNFFKQQLEAEKELVSENEQVDLCCEKITKYSARTVQLSEQIIKENEKLTNKDSQAVISLKVLTSFSRQIEDFESTIFKDFLIQYDESTDSIKPYIEQMTRYDQKLELCKDLGKVLSNSVYDIPSSLSQSAQIEHIQKKYESVISFKDSLLAKVQNYLEIVQTNDKNLKETYVNSTLQRLKNPEETIKEQKVKFKQIEIFVHTREKEIATFKINTEQLKGKQQEISSILGIADPSRNLFYSLIKVFLACVLAVLLYSVRQK